MERYIAKLLIHKITDDEGSEIFAKSDLHKQIVINAQPTVQEALEEMASSISMGLSLMKLKKEK